MNGINTNFGSKRIYTGKSNAVSNESNGTFSYLISESQKLPKNSESNFDFTDMYVSTHQTSSEEAVKDPYGASRPWANEKYLQVPVAGDLKELMESIEKGLSDGESLRNILQNRIDRYAKECGIDDVVAVGGETADLILIDPDTGKVIDSVPKGRCVILSKKIQNMDYSTAKSQADDLATFLRYTMFKKETDDPEKVGALISELKEKQTDYDTSRFLPIFSMSGEQGVKNVEYWKKVLGSDWAGFSDDERNDAADELLKILEERYSSKDSKTDAVYEEMEKMKFENVGKLKIARTVLQDALFKMY